MVESCFNHLFISPDAEIVKKMALGLKSYQVWLSDKKTSDVHHITKVRGFSLKSKVAQEALTSSKFEYFVAQLLEKKSEACHIPHFNILREKASRQLYSTISRKLFRNDVFNQRVAFKNHSYTLPYGYTDELYKKYVAGS